MMAGKWSQTGSHPSLLKGCLVPGPVHLLWLLFLDLSKHFSLKPMVVMLHFMEVERTSQWKTDPGNCTPHQTPQEDTLF